MKIKMEKSNNNNIQNISFKKINNNYSYGKYGNFEVIIMKKNGYINVTKLCNIVQTKNGTIKDFREWKKNSTTKALTNEVSAFTGVLLNELFIIPTNVQNDLKGTYAHPDLVPHIASWASPKFAVYVSEIVNKYFIRKALKEKEQEIIEKDDKIEKLNGTVEKMDDRIKNPPIKK